MSKTVASFINILHFLIYMNPDNFDIHLYSGGMVSYYHKNVKALIDSVTKEDRLKLENLAKELSQSFGKEIKLTWGFEGYNNIENVLGHIIIKQLRQGLHLSEPEGINVGYLKYRAHNLDNDYAKAPIFSILLQYISILDKNAVRKV